MNPQQPRTIVLDTARLLKNNKISKEEFSKFDRDFQQQVLACVSSLPKDEDLSKMTLTLKSNKPSAPKPVSSNLRPPRPRTDAQPAEPILSADELARAYKPPAAKMPEPSSISFVGAQNPYSRFGGGVVQPESVNVVVNVVKEAIQRISKEQENEIISEPVKEVVKQEIKPEIKQEIKQEKKAEPVAAAKLAPQKEPVSAWKPASAPAPKPPEPKPASVVVPPTPSSTIIFPEKLAPKTATDESELYDKDASLEEKKAAITKEIQALTLTRNSYLRDLELLRLHEKSVEDQEAAINMKEKESGTISSHKAIEEKRWSLEDQRQTYEKERWDIHQKIDDIEKQLSERNRQKGKIEAEQEKFKRDLEVITLKKEAEQARIDKVLEEKIQASTREKKRKYELDWIKSKSDMSHIREQIENLQSDVASMKKKIEETELLEKSASNEKDRHSFEEQRWQLEKSLRDVEKNQWDLESKVEGMARDVEELERVFAEIQIEEEQSREKIDKANLIIKKAERIV